MTGARARSAGGAIFVVIVTVILAVHNGPPTLVARGPGPTLPSVGPGWRLLPSTSATVAYFPLELFVVVITGILLRSLALHLSSIIVCTLLLILVLISLLVSIVHATRPR